LPPLTIGLLLPAIPWKQSDGRRRRAADG
jgi:hypothetical protein